MWAWIALAVWMPLNLHDLRAEQRATLAMDDEAYEFVEAINQWVVEHPATGTLVYDGLPRGYHHWGATAAWNIAHRSVGMPAYFREWPEAKKALAGGVVAYGTWEAGASRLVLRTRAPGP